VLVPNSINHEEYKSTDENRKVQRKREHSPNSSEKYSEILDLRNPGNQRVNALKRVIGREEKFKREKENEREERESKS